MISGKLWLEIVITGYLFFFTFVFLLLRVFNVQALPDIETYKDVLPYVVTVTTVFSYLTGLTMHRYLQIMGGNIFAFIERIFRLKSLANNVERKDRYRKFILIWQYGSPELNNEIRTHFSSVALYRSLFFAFPCFGFSFALWLSITKWNCIILPSIIITILSTIASFIVYRRQRQSSIMIRYSAIHEMEEIRSHQLGIEVNDKIDETKLPDLN